jgi:hypothetical protein
MIQSPCATFSQDLRENHLLNLSAPSSMVIEGVATLGIFFCVDFRLPGLLAFAET